MPSYRITSSIGQLRKGVRPESVLPGAAEAASALTTVEATNLEVVSGAARLVIRFTADDDDAAIAIAAEVVARTRSLASVSAWTLTRRVGGRWQVVRRG